MPKPLLVAPSGTTPFFILFSHRIFTHRNQQATVQLDTLKQYFNSYRSFLSSVQRHPEIHKWDALSHFESNWNLEKEDMAEMYNRSLDSQYTRRWWKTPTFNPKEVMLIFIREQTDLMRDAFRDLLYGDDKPVDRIDRFTFYCDQALKAYKQVHSDSIVNHHYHSSNHMCSLYLSLAHPDEYGPYFHYIFLSFLRNVKTRELPKNRDPERFFTLCNTLNNLLVKSEGIPAAFEAFLNKNQLHFDEYNHPLLAQDFMHFVGLEWTLE